MVAGGGVQQKRQVALSAGARRRSSEKRRHTEPVGVGVRAARGVVEPPLELGVEVEVRGGELGVRAARASAASVPARTRMSWWPSRITASSAWDRPDLFATLLRKMPPGVSSAAAVAKPRGPATRADATRARPRATRGACAVANITGDARTPSRVAIWGRCQRHVD